MPYIDDNVIESLDYFMTSIGRKRAWELLKKRMLSGGDCDNDGCAEAIKQTKINKANIDTNAGNIAANATNVDKNANDIDELKDRLNNLVIDGIDKADPNDVDEWFNDNE